jgi:hypothetical protein
LGATPFAGIYLAHDAKRIAGNRQRPDDMVIPSAHIAIRYSYPLANPVLFTEQARNGHFFTRADLA